MLDKNIVNDVIKTLPNYLILVGSWSRGEHGDDIDFISPIPLEDLKIDLIKNKDIKISKILENGHEFLSIIIYCKNRNVKLDIWYATTSQMPYMKFSRTRSKTFNIKARAQAKRLGYKLSDRQLLRGGEKVPAKTERQIFKLLKMRYESPKQTVY